VKAAGGVLGCFRVSAAHNLAQEARAELHGLVGGGALDPPGA